MSHSEAAAVMNERSGLRPRVGVVLGSGLGAVAEAVSDPTTIDYGELPGFPVPSVAGHGGQAVLGEIGAPTYLPRKPLSRATREATSTSSARR